MEPKTSRNRGQGILEAILILAVLITLLIGYEVVFNRNYAVIQKSVLSEEAK